MRFMTKTLEMDKILSKVVSYAKSETIRSQIANLTPMTVLNSVTKSLDETMDMTTLILRAGLIPFLENYDIHQLFGYASKKRTFSIQELLYVRLFLLLERDIIRYFKQLSHLKISALSLTSYFSEMHSHLSLLEYIDSKLDPDGQILDDATSQLFKLRREKSRLDKQLQEKLNKLMNDYSSYLNELVIVIRNDRFCLPVKGTFKNKIKGVVHDVSASMQTIYIEPESSRQITAKLEELKILEKKEIQKIVAELSEEVHLSNDTLESNLALMLTLDFISSKAQYALEIDAVKPLVNKDGNICLNNARHPLLEIEKAVPISLDLNKKRRILLITGPNTGGKTVALKTVGLLTLMTQCGLLIPANETSNIAIFDQVFADIGDEQSISQSLSTFSSHLTKIIKMIENVEKNALVLLDELGSGTDPNEGVSLAIAILNEFKTKDIRMMVTTHYSELKSYAYEQENMITASVAFDKKTLKPLYFLQMGTTGSSHAFLIARRLGLKESVVLDATKVYEGRQTDLAKVMEKLNDEMLYIQRQKEKLATEIFEGKKEKNEYKLAKKNLLIQQDKIIESISIKEEKKWSILKEDAKEIISELQKKNELSKPEIASLKYKLNQAANEKVVSSYADALKIGDDVFILPYQQYGKITAFKNEKYRVVFGQFKLDFNEYDLRKDAVKKEKTKNKKYKKTNIGTIPKKDAKIELDLRGYRYDEVYEAMEQAIDRLLLSNMTDLRIIHGFGSGAVRKAVYDYIKSSPYISSHRFGGEGEGLNGVTIITLK